MSFSICFLTELQYIFNKRILQRKPKTIPHITLSLIIVNIIFMKIKFIFQDTYSYNLKSNNVRLRNIFICKLFGLFIVIVVSQSTYKSCFAIYIHPVYSLGFHISHPFRINGFNYSAILLPIHTHKHH